MSTSALAPAAQDKIATLFVGFELSKATWLIGLYSPPLGAIQTGHQLILVLSPGCKPLTSLDSPMGAYQ